MGFLGFIYRQLFWPPKPIPASIDLSGQTAIVTGANVGLGMEASRELIEHQVSRIILGVRDVTKGEAAKAELAKSNPNCIIEIWPLDLESYGSIAQFAERANILKQIDIIILSAGVKKLDYVRSSYGHETNVQVNHLGNALFSLLLLDTIQQSASKTPRQFPARLTIVTSEMHMWTPFDEKAAPHILRRMDEENSFDDNRYPTSKLLNLLWAREIASRVKSSNVVINAVNPGFCLSSLHRQESSGFFSIFSRMIGWTSAQGGHCLVDAAVVKGVASHGLYISEQQITSPSGFVLSDEGQQIQKQLFHETVDLFKAEAPEIQIRLP